MENNTPQQQENAPENIAELSTREHIRRRPGMYIGSSDARGIADFITAVVTDIIELFGPGLLFHLFLRADNEVEIAIAGAVDEQVLVALMTKEKWDIENLNMVALSALCSKLLVTRSAGTVDVTDGVLHHISCDPFNVPGVSIKCTFIASLFRDIAVDMEYLSEKLFLVAMLNRHTELLLTDERHKYLIQQYYHYPDGVTYMFDRTCRELSPATLNLKVTIDESMNGRHYQVIIGYWASWSREAQIASFANSKHIECNGSLVEGVLKGIRLACKEYGTEAGVLLTSVKRKKVLNGLILVCHVRGAELQYTGAAKSCLDEPSVEKDIKQLVRKAILNHFRSDKESADKVMARFDRTNMLHEMY